MLASASLAACSGGDTQANGNSAEAPAAAATAATCDMNVPAEDVTEGRTLTEMQARRLEMAERHRVEREMGRRALACVAAAGFTGVDRMSLRRPGPTVQNADGSRGPTTENTWSGVGMRDGVRMRIVVDSSGTMTSGPLAGIR
ncbi:MAG: hypothetical protein AB7K35_14775 [Pseudorhodoplanes sp.]